MHGVYLLSIVLCLPVFALGCAGNASPEDAALPVDDGPIAWGEVVEVASGQAYQGPWRMNESDFRYVDAPSVAFGREGEVSVVWVDQAQKDVLYQRYDSHGEPQLEEPINISRSADIFSWLPRIRIGDEGDVYVLWQEIVFSGGSHGGEAFFARSTDGGESFSEPLNLSNTPHGAGKGRLTRGRWDNGSLDLALGPDGALYAAWTEYEGGLKLRRSTDGGATFEEPTVVVESRHELPARGPSLAVDPQGAVFLAWTVGEDHGADIHFARSSDGGQTFGAPSVVGSSTGHSDAPKLAVDGTGTLHLVYSESPDGMLGRYHLRYVRSENGGQTFEQPREIISIEGDGFEGMNYPAMEVDDHGTVYLVWEFFHNVRERPRALGFSVSRDGGETFEPPTTVPGTGDPALGFNGSLQGMLMHKLAVHEDGGVAIVNGTFNPDVESRIRLIRGERAD